MKFMLALAVIGLALLQQLLILGSSINNIGNLALALVNSKPITQK